MRDLNSSIFRWKEKKSKFLSPIPDVWKSANSSIRMVSLSENSNPIIKIKNESRRAEVIAQFLSDVLLLHLIEFRQYKARRNFRSSNFENARHVIYLGVT